MYSHTEAEKKMATILQIHFRAWKRLYFETNFTKFVLNGPINRKPALFYHDIKHSSYHPQIPHNHVQGQTNEWTGLLWIS